MSRSNRVEETNDSSTISKLSALKANYLDDPVGMKLLNWFVKYERRTSLINRGYFIRMLAIQRLLDEFIAQSCGEAIQLVNLGAGFDPLFLRLLIESSTAAEHANHHFVEVDLENVVRRKSAVIRSRIESGEADNGRFPDDCKNNADRIFSNYDLIACDLTDTEALTRKLLDCGLQPDRPTLFIAECVLNYLTDAAADNLLITLSRSFSRSTFIVYEQIEPSDKFGQTMLKHFVAIKSPLLSINTYPTAKSQRERYFNLGFPVVDCWTIGHLYYALLDSKERRRIAKLELFDEHEMWHVKCAHYVITVASTCSGRLIRFHQHDFSPSDLTIAPPLPSASLQCQQRPILSSTNAHYRRFGHSSALIKRVSNGQRISRLLSFGGWGIGDNNAQSRLRKPCLLDFATLNASNCEIRIASGTSDDSIYNHRLLERCYSMLVPAKEKDSFFAFGGRRSPEEALASPVLVRLVEGSAVQVEQIATVNRGPSGRWRHASTVIRRPWESNGNAFIVICGGLESGNEDPLSDFWILNLSDLVWIGLSDLPIAVHSHSICYDCRHQLLIVVGGLTGDEVPADHIQVYSFVTNSWTLLEAPASCRRYGSVCMYYNSVVLLVGGVSPSMGECHDITVLKFQVEEKQLPEIEAVHTLQLPETADVMLMNHNALLDEEERKIYVLGGGGNCFSFGTCFNEVVLEINLDSLVDGLSR